MTQLLVFIFVFVFILIFNPQPALLSRKLKSLIPNEEGIFKFLDRIKGGIDRLNGLIQSNLNLSQIEISNDKIKINKSDFSFIELINDILDKNSNLVTTKRIKIVSDLNNLPQSYNGDKKLLDHCFTNVISNAIKYSHENSEVKIKGYIENQNLIISVYDHGIGIPKEDVENVGKKFFRAKNVVFF